ncbi:MAG: pseudouridine synthase [Albidovulum sp.]
MTDETATGERIAKVMARAGVASRRDAEKMILAGRVAVNGTVTTSPALDVMPSDKVTLDGKPIDAPQPARLWLYYKPVGLVTSAKDEKGRQTVFDTMPEGMPRVMSVGRLDLNSEGLLLLTNDGELKRRLELPSTGWLRKYRVRVNGRPNEATFDPLRRGITIEGEDFQPMEVTLDKQQGANAWLTVGIREGRNREVRRAMAEVGLVVNRLIRVSYGPFRLNTMKPGDVVEVKQRVLRDQLGSTGDAEAGAARSGAGQAPRKPRAGGAAPGKGRAPKPRPLGEDRPLRAGSRFAGKDAPRPRPLIEEETGDRPPRSRHGEASRPPRKGSGERPFKPRAARGEDNSRPPRKGSGERPFKPRAPRGEDDSRPPRKGAGERPFKPRAPRGEDESRPPRKGSGERPFKPRTPRDADEARPPRKAAAGSADGGQAFRARGPRPERDDPPGDRGGDRGGREDRRPFKPRAAPPGSGPAGTRSDRHEGPRGPKPGPRPGSKPGPGPGGKSGPKSGPNSGPKHGGRPGPKPRGRS